MNKYLLHFFTLTCSILFSLGQVPAPESEGVSPEITKLISLGDESQVFFFCVSAQPEFGMVISG